MLVFSLSLIIQLTDRTIELPSTSSSPRAGSGASVIFIAFCNLDANNSSNG